MEGVNTRRRQQAGTKQQQQHPPPKAGSTNPHLAQHPCVVAHTAECLREGSFVAGQPSYGQWRQHPRIDT